MRLLLDAHALLWATGDSSKLSETARTAINDTDNDVLVSIATLWEIAIKSNIGKLTIPADFFEKLEPSGYEILEIQLEHVRHYQTLPLHHRDPFDRILVAQTACEGLTLVTRDPLFDPYGITTLTA